jgi:glycosyltransferase involved in cell wall biosynthesis
MRLNLFFTQGVSLKTWEQIGTLNREVAIYQRFKEIGVDVSFVTYGGKGDIALGRTLGIDVLSNVFNLPENLYRWKLELSPPEGDVFKSNQIFGADLALVAAARVGAKFIARCGYLLSLNEEASKGFDTPQAQFARELEKKVFSSADKVIVTTEFNARTVAERYSVAKEKIAVIPNYVNTELFKPERKATSNRFRIGFVGRFAPEKNLDILLQSLKGLDVEVVFAGNGREQANLEAIAAAEGISVSFAGTVPNDDLPTLLNSLDLFALISKYEGHPKALIEAMACGLPILGTRVRGIADLIRDRETGYLCEPATDDIRATIVEIMNDVGREKIGQAARDFAEANFSLARVVGLEMDVLTQVLTNA